MNKYNKQISFAKHLIFVYGWGDITFPLFHDNGSPWYGGEQLPFYLSGDEGNISENIKEESSWGAIGAKEKKHSCPNITIL
jgi:hypothetical protein